MSTRSKRNNRRQYSAPVKAAAAPAAAPSAAEKLGLHNPANAQAYDVFTNIAARTGAFSGSLEDGTSHILTRLTLDFWALCVLYEESWLARRIVDAPAADMMKTWPRIVCEADPRDLARIDNAVRRTNTRGAMLQGMQWGRLFGGAGALIVVKGHEHELDQPLDLETIPLGGFKGLSIFDRWSGIQPTGDVCEDLERPLDVNLPEYYEVSARSGGSFRVHASRILRFCGPKMPEPENSVYSGWGISVLAPVMQSLNSYDNISANALSLSFRANLIGLKEDQLSQVLSGAGMNQNAAFAYAQRMQAINQSISNQSLIVLPKEGGLENIQYSFGGLSDLIQMFQLQLAGAARMPVSLLWGKLYNGLGNSGDGDERIYEKTVASDADGTLRPALEKLLPVVMMSELGEVPADFSLDFPSIRVLDEKEKSDLARTVADTVVVALNSGLISPRAAAMELKQASDYTGVFSNLTDERIAALSDEVQSEGEIAGGNLFGVESDGAQELTASSSPQEVLREKATQHKDAERAEHAQDKYKPAFDSTQARDADLTPVTTRKVHGLTCRIETPKGETRSGPGWELALPYDYGYIEGVPAGADGDSLDCALGTDSDATWVYVFDQRKLNGTGFDEHKCFLAWPNAKAALNAFKCGHSHWQQVLMDWTPMPVDEFLVWAAKGDHTRPVGGVKK